MIFARRFLRLWTVTLLLSLSWMLLAPGTSSGAWQEPAGETTLTDPLESEGSSEQPAAKSSKAGKSRLLTLLFAGDPIGIGLSLLIMSLSVVGVYFTIEHALTINKGKLMPEDVLGELEQRIARGEIDQAIEFCHQPENFCLVSEVILAGLERYRSSEYGFAEYKTAVEEAGEDVTGRLYRKTEVLNVIGQVAPMLGLLGTVLGMISAFMTIAEKQGMAKPEELAGGIGEALITTLLGLIAAIPALVALSFFRTKIDSLVAEAGKRVERVLLPLGRKRA